MRLISTQSLEEKTTLAKPVYNDKGQILINEGVTLTKRMINRLNELGITFVYIEQKHTEDIVTNHPISQKTRTEAIEAIEDAFDVVQKEGELAKAFVIDKMGKRFSNLISNILHDVQGNKEAISLLSDIYSYDNYIFTHSLNVTIYALALGLELKLPEKKLQEIGLGAIMHDVGKMDIPLNVLLKPGRLTSEEFGVIKKHTEAGFNILRNVPTIPLVAAHCAYQHHERLDGSGYPRGLKGEDIHFYGRLLAIADVYDAVTSNRVYRSAMLPHEGLEILYAGAGSQFDLQMVEAFRKAIAVYPVGLNVYLSDGRRGIVVKQNKLLSERPVIRILAENSKELETPYELDLSKELTVVIAETDTTLKDKNN